MVREERMRKYQEMKRLRKWKTQYKSHREQTGGSLYYLKEKAKEFLNKPDEEIYKNFHPAYVVGLADDLMKFTYPDELGKGPNYHDPEAALLGAKLYEKIGGGNRESVRRRLSRAVKERPHMANMKEINTFLEKNSFKSGLEKKATTTMSILSLVGGLFFLYPSITGAAVGALAQNGSDIWGVIMLVFGLFGLFFSLR